MKALVSLVAVLALVVIAYIGVGLAGLDTLFGVVLPYASFFLLLVGIVYRVVVWAKTPVPFRIPTSCGQQKSLSWIKSSKLDNPNTSWGVIGRMLLEVLFFRSLFRNTRTDLGAGPKVTYSYTLWLWLAGLAFHYSFLFVFLRHMRFFSDPIPAWVLAIQNVDGFFEIGVPVFYITSVMLVGSLAYLLVRRLWIPQVRYISLLNDYFPLFLLLGIGLSGLLLRHFVKTDVVGIKELASSLAVFSPKLPSTEVHWLFYAHLFLVCVLFMYFPFSKLMHFVGVFLSPARNMANNNRAVRHINPWNYPVKVHTYEEYEDEFREKMKGAGLPVDKE